MLRIVVVVQVLQVGGGLPSVLVIKFLHVLRILLLLDLLHGSELSILIRC